MQDLYIRLWSGRDKLETILRPEAMTPRNQKD